MRRALMAAAVLGMLAAGESQAALVLGVNNGVFVNASPPGATTTGSDTGSFTYGQGNPPPPNSLNYSPNNPISSTTETPFTLGRLTYFNGTTAAGTVPDSVDLQITLNLTEPAVVTRTFTFTLNLVVTSNVGDPDQDADFVFFPASITSQTFSGGGQTYTLALTGFGNVQGDGFLASNSSQFRVREGGTASADLMGIVTTNVAATPEPTTLASAGFGALALGLYGLRRHRSRVA